MKEKERFSELAISIAKTAGELLREERKKEQSIQEENQHDIKIHLDKKCQTLIEKKILQHFPTHSIVGEEGTKENQNSKYQWIIDPIDGTVNFYHQIPHFCISIALRYEEKIQLGVIYDPCIDELWYATLDEPSTLNGKEIKVSQRQDLDKAILFIGCGKDGEAGEIGATRFTKGVQFGRKVRAMGSAALGLAYIASGRFDAYLEEKISLWDIAAGKIILEQAGGRVLITENPKLANTYSIIADNGKLNLSPILE